MKDPAFLFYPNDWLGGTLGMTFEEKGAYIELLMLQFNRGHMTEHMIGQVIGQIWDRIKDKFKMDAAGLYYNQRLDDEISKRQNYCKSRRNNVSGTNQYSKGKTDSGAPAAASAGSGRSYGRSHDQQVTSHMENENENEDQHTNNQEVIGKGVQRENHTPYQRWNPDDNIVITSQVEETVRRRIDRDLGR